ncbi:MAG: MFS transporter [Cytophagales bacterium]|nr:MFS transporter [Cytophagales bacterium]
MSETNEYHSLKSTIGKWTIISTILASSMAFIDATALNVILPSLQRDLGANATDLFWVLNGYLLMLSALIIVGGSLGDKLGRVKMFKIGILIFTIGSILCGLSPSIRSLIIFRMIQGTGGALMIPGSLAIISSIFSEKEKGKAIGTWSAATTIVGICGPVLGGALADIGLWRFIFYINVPLGIFSWLVLHLKVPESREPGAATIDWWGATLLVVSLACLTFGFLEMPEWGFQHPVVIASLIFGILAFLFFLKIERHANAPMMPLSLFHNRTFAGLNLLSFFLYAGLGAIMLFLSLNMIQAQGYSQLEAGLTFLPFSVIMVSLARKMGSLTDRYGARPFLIIGPALTGLGMLWMSMIGNTLGPSEYWTTFFPPLVVFALGMAITVVPLTSAVMTCLDVSKSGIASGINNSVTRIASTFINAIMGAVAIMIFTNYVAEVMDRFEFEENIRSEIVIEAAKFGEARAPEQLATNLQFQINKMFIWGFISTYQIVALLSAVLAFVSSGIAFFMVEKKNKNDGETTA